MIASLADCFARLAFIFDSYFLLLLIADADMMFSCRHRPVWQFRRRHTPLSAAVFRDAIDAA